MKEHNLHNNNPFGLRNKNMGIAHVFLSSWGLAHVGGGFRAVELKKRCHCERQRGNPVNLALL
jgi:hypothetical protein